MKCKWHLFNRIEFSRDEANKDDIKQFNEEIDGIKPDIENNSDFQCYHCGRYFQTLGKVKEHIQELHRYHAGLTIVYFEKIFLQYRHKKHENQ